MILVNLTAACMVTVAHKLGNVVWTVPKSENIITYSSESRTHRHVTHIVRTNKKATLQSRDYPAIETSASKSGVWSHDLKVENTITYGSESRAHKHVRTNKKATLQSRDCPAIKIQVYCIIYLLVHYI